MAAPARDDGIGLVEVVVTMFLLSIVAIAFLPFLLNSYLAASANGERATGNQAVSDAMQRLRVDMEAADRDCDWFANWVATRSGALADASLTLTGTVDCPASAPGAAKVDFRVRDAAGEVIASASTKVYVAS